MSALSVIATAFSKGNENEDDVDSIRLDSIPRGNVPERPLISKQRAPLAQLYKPTNVRFGFAGVLRDRLRAGLHDFHLLRSQVDVGR